MTRLLSVGLFSLYFLSSVALAGAGSSGGLDWYRYDEGAAWFVDFPHAKRSIPACTQIAHDFPHSVTALREKIERSFANWSRYYHSKSYTNSILPRPAFNLSWTSCDDADLVFYFGTEPARVRTAKLLFGDPVSFAYRTSYDQEAGWGQGFVWVKHASDIRNPQLPLGDSDVIEVILHHEIGHVLGNAHAPGTIMDNGLLSQIVEEVGTGTVSRLFSIDRIRELMPCIYNCKNRYQGKLNPRAYHWLRSIRTREHHPAELIRQSEGDTLTLVIRDHQGAHRFPLAAPRGNFPYLFARGAGPVFKLAAAGIAPASNMTDASFLSIHFLTNHAGETRPFIFQRNGLVGNNKLSMILTHTIETIFEGSLVQ